MNYLAPCSCLSLSAPPSICKVNQSHKFPLVLMLSRVNDLCLCVYVCVCFIGFFLNHYSTWIIFNRSMRWSGERRGDCSILPKFIIESWEKETLKKILLPKFSTNNREIVNFWKKKSCIFQHLFFKTFLKRGREERGRISQWRFKLKIGKDLKLWKRIKINYFGIFFS